MITLDALQEISKLDISEASDIAKKALEDIGNLSPPHPLYEQSPLKSYEDPDP